MFRRGRTTLILPALILSLAFPNFVRAQAIDAGVAITDSDALQELEVNGFALSALMSAGWQRGARTPVLDNAKLAELPAFQALHAIVREEFKLYDKSYLDRFPDARDNFGVGTEPDNRTFERNWLRSSAARFDLVGVVNRMDRTFRSPETCGEVRFIYRLAYRVKAANQVEFENNDGARDLKREGEIWTQTRMPMTINLVLRARNALAPGSPAPVSCQDLAKRWLAIGTSGKTGRDLARLVVAQGGALALVEPSQIDRMETNIQVVRVPSTVVAAFGGNAEYLLHIFKWDPVARTFSPAPLENQVDTIALLKDPAKLARLKAWLFTPEHLYQLIEGTILIPEEFLAMRAITSAPGGTARATNRPFLGLISTEEAAEALKNLSDAARQFDPEKKLRSIASPLGLEQRLNDMTCTGCHQSRAIGGFHFLGADWKSTIRELPQNSIFIAGSPHFYGDLPRRRAVVKAIAAGKPSLVDYGRGFSMRPRRTARGGDVIFDTRFDALRNGWGANCVVEPPRGQKKDASFNDWNCAEGLVCRALHESTLEPGLGVCINPVKLDNAARTGVASKSEPERSGLKIGDPFLFGRLTFEKVYEPGSDANRAYRYRDGYCSEADILNGNKAAPGMCLRTPGEKGSGDYRPAAYQGGGFFAGMHKRKTCKPLPPNSSLPSGAVCGSEAGTLFTQCAVENTKDGKTSFVPCLTLPIASDKATLRACSVLEPCRDDYVCLATKGSPRTEKGACLPPYFLFQFRIDGHPTPPEGSAEAR